MGAFGGTYFRPIYSSVTGKKYTPKTAMRGLPKSGQVELIWTKK